MESIYNTFFKLIKLFFQKEENQNVFHSDKLTVYLRLQHQFVLTDDAFTLENWKVQ